MFRVVISAMLCSVSAPLIAQNSETRILSQNSYDLFGSGRSFLLSEARRVDFFMLGELHGEREIPELLTSLWPEFYTANYHYVAAEISEWAASKLEFSNERDSLNVEGLWTNREAQMIHSSADEKNEKIIWGCDMEEIALGDLLKEFLIKNPTYKNSHQALNTIEKGYDRTLAPELLVQLNNGSSDKFRDNDLYQSIIVSLRIDSARNFPQSRFKAQLLREELMKKSFLKNYNSSSRSKVFLRFGRNHLHYGFDERGISTLGNFVSEFSLSRDLKCFNVATFATGGECRLMGNTFSADERNDDLAFLFFSQVAKHEATLFDLRPLRIYLHTIAYEKRSETQRRLLYWADSYDAIICFMSVTPR